MNRNRTKRLPILAGLFVLGLCAAVAYAAGGWSIVGYDVSGNTVTTEVRNSAGRTVTGTISVQVVKDGQTYSGVSDSVSISSGATVHIPIIVGTITDDITPFTAIAFAINTN